MQRRQKFALCAIYDTETCNVGKNEKTRAFPILFIDNDIRGVDIAKYQIDKDDSISFYRYEQEYQDRIDEYIRWGNVVGKVPIICAYNLMFDLRPLMYELNNRYDIKVNAQSSTNVYTLDLYEQETDKMLLRFWDTFHLEMRGLDAMGKTCGINKAVGEWDYSLIRTPETPLTEQELYYAKRDVQVIPAYLRYLLKANEWMKQEDFGYRILTKTSIVRQMAKRVIGAEKITTKDGKKVSLDKLHTLVCAEELPNSYDIYALRRACFRGGFTFTSAAYASTIQHNVFSADVVSMHHTFINGRFLPVKFEVKDQKYLDFVCNKIIETTREEVLANYHKPFEWAIHARIRFYNLRLRKDSCFDKWGIALESSSKCKKFLRYTADSASNETTIINDNVMRELGWFDRLEDETIAFSKVYSARIAELHLSELELWGLSRVYEWDKLETIYGEVTSSFNRPPDFVTLQSNMLFELKTKAKQISEQYIEGVPYDGNLDGIPDGLSETLRNGTCKKQFFKEWYTNTIKGMFNGIFGSQAQDVYKGNFVVVGGDIKADPLDVCTPENFDSKRPKTTRVLYTYGLRIVGGSRMHMIIALELMYEKFGDNIRILGGDTDSIKGSIIGEITDSDLECALMPLATASKNAIDETMKRVRKMYPNLCSTLDDIGAFEIENKGKHYETHIELWNKARVSWDGEAHVTCAGLSRPIGKYHIENVIEDLAEKYDIELVLKTVMGYDVFIDNNICHALEGKIPKAGDIFEKTITDYLGTKTKVRVHESVALYPAGRFLGETRKRANRQTVDYLKRVYNRDIDTKGKYVGLEEGNVIIREDSESGEDIIMKVEV